MAGIGIELRKLLSKEGYLATISAYSYAGIVCSGPWLLSIVTIFILILIAEYYQIPIETSHAFEAITVYLIAGSLILSSVFHHTYTRYIANNYFVHKIDQVIPSLNSLYLVMTLVAGCVGTVLINFMLPDPDPQLKIIIIPCFVILCLIWITTSVLSGLLAYKTIFFAFLGNFLITFLVSWFLVPHGLYGLMLAFLLGEFFLLFILIYSIYHYYPGNELINFHFFRLENINKELLLTGLFYNLAIWIDKFIFWYSPATGTTVIGKFHQSIVYDTPIFLAYLAIIPAMSIFLMHLETDYSEAHESLYKKIRGHYTFNEIHDSYKILTKEIRETIFSVVKTQAFVILVGITLGTATFLFFHISTIYIPLFYICLLGASLNVLLWSIMDIVFYLDKTNHAVKLNLVFLMTNALFTWASIQMGFYFFGYGLVVGLLITVLLSFALLNRDLSKLLYETYMLR